MIVCLVICQLPQNTASAQSHEILTQHVWYPFEAVLTRDIVNSYSAVDSGRAQVFAHLGPFDCILLPNLHLIQCHLQEAYNIVAAVDVHFTGAYGGGAHVREVQGAANKGGSSGAAVTQHGNVDILHGRGRVAVARLESPRSVLQRGGVLDEKQLTATEGAGERGLGRVSAGGPGRRVLMCVGERGPSVSEDESAELDETWSAPG